MPERKEGEMCGGVGVGLAARRQSASHLSKGLFYNLRGAKSSHLSTKISCPFQLKCWIKKSPCSHQL